MINWQQNSTLKYVILGFLLFCIVCSIHPVYAYNAPNLDVSFTVTPSTLTSGESAQVIVQVITSNNREPVPGASITFSTTILKVSPSQGSTDSQGYFHATLTAPLNTGGTDHVVAYAQYGEGYFGENSLDVNIQMVMAPPPQPQPPRGLNIPPVVNADANPTSGSAPLMVNFDAGKSYDSDGSIAEYSWNFADGETGTGSQIWHQYKNPGVYVAALTVIDNRGLTSTSGPIQITVQQLSEKESTLRIPAPVEKKIKDIVPEQIHCSRPDDLDCDGVPNTRDNCPDIYNPDQKDSHIKLAARIPRTIDGPLLPNQTFPTVCTYETGNGIGDACEPFIRLLFVPLNWKGTQADFDATVDTQMTFFKNSIPLQNCSYRINETRLDVKTWNYNTFSCYKPDGHFKDDAGLDDVISFVRGSGFQPENYDVIVGIVKQTPCPSDPDIMGMSNLRTAVWVTTTHTGVTYDSVLAHEMGHIFGLSDEYCSNPAGSTDCRCNDGDQGSTKCGDKGNDGAVTGDVNWLDPKLGCNPAGVSCCNKIATCGWVNYNPCCEGNNATELSGRCIMSYANADDPRQFCTHCRDHLSQVAQLQCHSPVQPVEQNIIDLSLQVYPDDRVTEGKIMLTYGRSLPEFRNGDQYDLRVMDRTGGTVWEQKFNLYFDYNGPVIKGNDYSKIKFDSSSINDRIPYDPAMKKLELYHNSTLIFSKDLNFCNKNGFCDTTETYLTCPQDCPLDKKDNICLNQKDGICDPDCLVGVDPDCSGLSGSLLVLPGIALVIIAGGVLILLIRKRRRKPVNT